MFKERIENMIKHAADDGGDDGGDIGMSEDYLAGVFSDDASAASDDTSDSQSEQDVDVASAEPSGDGGGATSDDSGETEQRAEASDEPDNGVDAEQETEESEEDVPPGGEKWVERMTKKSQQLADDRRALDEERQQFEQQRTEMMERLAALEQRLEGRPEEDWVDDDPYGFDDADDPDVHPKVKEALEFYEQQKRQQQAEQERQQREALQKQQAEFLEERARECDAIAEAYGIGDKNAKHPGAELMLHMAMSGEQDAAKAAKEFYKGRRQQPAPRTKSNDSAPGGVLPGGGSKPPTRPQPNVDPNDPQYKDWLQSEFASIMTGD